METRGFNRLVNQISIMKIYRTYKYEISPFRYAAVE